MRTARMRVAREEGMLVRRQYVRTREQLRAVILEVLYGHPETGYALPLHTLKMEVWADQSQVIGWATLTNTGLAQLERRGAILMRSTPRWGRAAGVRA